MAVVTFKAGDLPVGNTFKFVAPRFSGRCVCCSADAQGQTLSYDVSSGTIRAPLVPMPVCAACIPHALARARAAIRVGGLLVLGIGSVVFGLISLAKEGNPGFARGMLLGGAVAVAVAVAWGFMQSARERNDRQPGHHPRLHFQVHPGITLLLTENEALVEELLALNPTAKRAEPPKTDDSGS
jgi:hypothetical protein